MADTTAVPVEMDLVALLVEVLVLITIVHLEAGVVILETTHLMEDAMIGTMTMDHLETALAMEDLTDLVQEEVCWILLNCWLKLNYYY